MKKNNEERFVFSDMGYQDFPNETNKKCIVVKKDISLVGKKYLGGRIVEKTKEDLTAEAAAKNAELDAKYKAERTAALSSPELTIFHDSTLPQGEKDRINDVRQEWYNMTAQAGYPVDFVRPQLDAAQ